MLQKGVQAQRQAELAVPTCDIIDKALSIGPQFENANQVTLAGSVYTFLRRNNNRISIITNTPMQSVRCAYCQCLTMSYANRIKNPHYLINMNENEVWLNCSIKHEGREECIHQYCRGCFHAIYLGCHCSHRWNKTASFYYF